MSQLPESVTLPQPLVQQDSSIALPELDQICWQQLVSDSEQDHPDGGGFKTMTVATRTNQGADARMVVLRQVDEAHKYVWFHTDARAEKARQLEGFPVAMLLFWDAKRQVQLRLTVETRLHIDDYIADNHWKDLKVSSRKSYLSEYAPGSDQLAPYPGFPEYLGENLPSIEESEGGRKNFAVIECRVLALEYLHLSRSGQTRARFQYEPNSRMTWLAP